MDPAAWDALLAKLTGQSGPATGEPGPLTETTVLPVSSTPIVDAWEGLLDKLRGSPSDESTGEYTPIPLVPEAFPTQEIVAPADTGPVEDRLASRATRREFLRTKIERELNKRMFIPSREAESIAYLLLELEELEGADQNDLDFINSARAGETVYLDAEVIPVT